MTYEVWQGFAQNDAGDVLDTATVTVTLAGTTTKPALFSDEDGTGSKTNPFNTDSSGFVQFYTAPAIVDIVATKGAFSVTFSNVRIGLPDALQTVSTLGELLATTPSDLDKRKVTSYLNGWAAKLEKPLGGGDFIYSTSTLKSLHNGVNIFSDTVPFDGNAASRDALLAGTGETDGGGSGCWIRLASPVEVFENAGAVGDGSFDDTMALQKAVEVYREVYGSPDRTYIVAPQALVTPDGGTGICTDIPSNTTIRLNSCTIKQKSGTSGTGGILSNSVPVDKVNIFGPGTIDGNKNNTTGNMPTAVLFRATNSKIHHVTTQNNRFIGLGFRANELGAGANSIAHCHVKDSVYIGISCNKQEFGVDVMFNTVAECGDNGIDIEGNRDTGDPSIGDAHRVIGNYLKNVLTGVFMESVGRATIDGNFVDGFSNAGFVFNRINSGSYESTVVNNNISNGGVGATGMNIANSSGRMRIDCNSIKDVRAGITCDGTAEKLVIGEMNTYANVQDVLIELTAEANALVRSKIKEQNYLDAKVAGKPFTISPVDNTNNFSSRSFSNKISPAYFMDDGLTAATLEDEYKTGVTGVLQTQGAFTSPNGYTVYADRGDGTFETFMSTTAALNSGYYSTINGTLYQIIYYGTPQYYYVRSFAGASGDYTTAIDNNYALVEYFPEWQEG